MVCILTLKLYFLHPMTDRLWRYERNVIQSVMLSKTIEDQATKLPLIGRIKVNINIIKKQSRTLILVFFFLFMLGVIDHTQLLYKNKAQKKIKSGEKPIQTLIRRQLTVYAFIDSWTTEVTKINLLDILRKQYLVTGCSIMFSKIIRPRYVFRLSKLDPGLEYFLQNSGTSEIIFTRKFVEKSSSENLDYKWLTFQNKFYCKSLAI